MSVRPSWESMSQNQQSPPPKTKPNQKVWKSMDIFVNTLVFFFKSESNTNVIKFL